MSHFSSQSNQHSKFPSSPIAYPAKFIRTEAPVKLAHNKMVEPTSPQQDIIRQSGKTYSSPSNQLTGDSTTISSRPLNVRNVSPKQISDVEICLSLENQPPHSSVRQALNVSQESVFELNEKYVALETGTRRKYNTKNRLGLRIPRANNVSVTKAYEREKKMEQSEQKHGQMNLMRVNATSMLG